MERKIIHFDNGKEVITEGAIVVEFKNSKVNSEESLQSLTDEDFKKLKDNPTKFKFDNGKVTLIR